MKNTKIPAKGVSRREFIQSSATATIGMMFLGTLGETEAHARQGDPHKEGLEQWLLRTGRDKVDPALYKAVGRYF